MGRPRANPNLPGNGALPEPPLRKKLKAHEGILTVNQSPPSGERPGSLRHEADRGPSRKAPRGAILLSVCGNPQFVNRSGIFQGLWNGFVDAMCPGITFDVTWKNRGGVWIPTQVVRDAFPTLDVITKNAQGILEVVNSSPESKRAGPMALTGLLKLKYDIQTKKEELLQDLNDSGCNLQ